MLDHAEFNADIKKLLKLIDRKFGIQSDDLAQAMRKVGRRLPKSAHRNAALLVKAQQEATHPKLARQLDEVALIKPYAALMAALEGYDPADARKGAILGTLGGLAFNLIVVFVLFIAVLLWRGYL